MKIVTGPTDHLWGDTAQEQPLLIPPEDFPAISTPSAPLSGSGPDPEGRGTGCGSSHLSCHGRPGLAVGSLLVDPLHGLLVLGARPVLRLLVRNIRRRCELLGFGCRGRRGLHDLGIVGAGA